MVNLIKHFMIVIYDSIVVWLGNCPCYDSRVVNYDRKMFIRLATDSCFMLRPATYDDDDDDDGARIRKLLKFYCSSSSSRSGSSSSGRLKKGLQQSILCRPNLCLTLSLCSLILSHLSKNINLFSFSNNKNTFTQFSFGTRPRGGIYKLYVRENLWTDGIH